jgi:hypothetical protein
LTATENAGKREGSNLRRCHEPFRTHRPRGPSSPPARSRLQETESPQYYRKNNVPAQAKVDPVSGSTNFKGNKEGTPPSARAGARRWASGVERSWVVFGDIDTSVDPAKS